MFTQQQYQQLKTVALADPIASQYIANGDDTALQNWFNSSTNSYVVWRTSVRKEEILRSDSFDWTRVDNLTVGKARIWDMLFDNASKTIDASKVNVRSGIAAAWVGTAADLLVRDAVLAVCKRYATIAENVFAVGLGTTVSPSVLSFEGNITLFDAMQIRMI